MRTWTMRRGTWTFLATMSAVAGVAGYAHSQNLTVRGTTTGEGAASFLNTVNVQGLTTLQGNVGLGVTATSDPTYGRLLIGGTSDTSNAMTIRGAASGALFLVDANNRGGAISYSQSRNAMDLWAYDATAAQSLPQATITSTGIGIGTQSPREKLEVQGGIRIGEWSTIKVTDYNGRVTWYGNAATNIRLYGEPATGITQSQGDIWFRSAPTGTAGSTIAWTETMRMTQAGNLGIGTSAPTERLHVAKQAGTDQTMAKFGDSPNAIFLSSNPSAISAGAYNNNGWKYDGTGTIPAAIWFQGTTSGINFLTASAAGSADAAATLTSRMQIATGGNIGIGTTAVPTDKLQVVGDVRVGTSGTNGCLKRADGTGLIGTCSSDERLKRDIEPLANVLDKVTALQPVTYKWKKEEYPERHLGDGKGYGLIAQQVATVLPELVGNDEKGFKTVKYGPEIEMLLIQAVKEQQQQINQLRNEIAALKRGSK